jgi:surfactin synthase thioesterase subunit
MTLRLLAALILISPGPPILAKDTSCLGPEAAPQALLYLHGLEEPDKKSAEEQGNRQVLERIARDLNFRVVLPQAPRRCAKSKLCWPGSSPEEIRSTFTFLQQALKSCGAGDRPYVLLGFSNGGYYAFKLWKIERDPRLRLVLASGSAGQWQPGSDRGHPEAPFRLMIGTQELTYKKAKQLASELKKSLPQFELDTFAGGHRLDYPTLEKILKFHLPTDRP